MAANQIIIAEDDEFLGHLLKFKLEKSGYEVTWLTDGKQALEAIQQTPPVLVLLDVLMPGLTGFEVLENIKSNSELRQIPVIMLTGSDMESDILKGINMGASDYIIKPFRPAELVARVQRHIQAA